MSKYNKFKFKNLLYYAVSFLVVIALLGVFTRTSSSASNTEVKKLKQQLEMQKVNYENQIESQKTSYESQINEQKTNYENQIQDLNNTNNTLSSEVENYYNYEYSLIIDFYVEDELYMTGKARNGGTLLVSPTEPTKENYNFKGWSLTSDGSVIDLSINVFTSDTTLYAIFEEVQAELTDLTGTTWIFNETITAEAGYGQFQIDAMWGSELGVIDMFGSGSLCVGYELDGETMNFNEKSDSFIDSSSMVQDGENYAKVLYITSGNDVTNTDLISWLKSNATQADLIIFYIGSEIQIAETGMTWNEWLSSDYNTGLYLYDNGKILSSYHMHTVDNVLPTDEIKLNENYTVTKIEL